MKWKTCTILAGAMLLAGQLQLAEAAFSMGQIANNIGSIGRNPVSSGKYEANRAVDSAVNKAVEKAVQSMDEKRIVFKNLPQSAAEVRPDTNAQQVAGYAVAALARYETSPEEAIAMLNALLGPRPVDGIGKQFLQDRFRGKPYLMRSYFKGAKPENNYQPTMPYTVVVQTNAYTYQEKDYARFMIVCGGADSPRPLTLRKKPSTGEWFLWDYKGLLSGIRIPVAEDPWS